MERQRDTELPKLKMHYKILVDNFWLKSIDLYVVYSQVLATAFVYVSATGVDLTT